MTVRPEHKKPVWLQTGFFAGKTILNRYTKVFML